MRISWWYAALAGAVVTIAVTGLVIAGTSAPAPDPDDPSAPTSSAAPAMPEVGDCLVLTKGEVRKQRTAYEPQPCRAPHHAEVISVLGPADAPTPKNWLSPVCRRPFERYVGGHFWDSVIAPLVLDVFDDGDSGTSWHVCTAIISGEFERPVPQSHRRSVRGVLTSQVPVQMRRCVNTFRRLVDCSKPHRGEQLTMAVPLGGPNADYPGRKGIERAAHRGCAIAFIDVDVKDRYAGRDPQKQWWYPNAKLWRQGMRHLACWAYAREGTFPPVDGPLYR